MKNGNLIMAREVARIDDPKAAPGSTPGHRARRLIDSGDVAFTDPFLILAEDWVPRDAFPVHPHRGIETITMVLDGVLEHSDSAGHNGIIRAGDAQWMTAGRGIQHEENVPAGTTAHTLQLWVNLPAAAKMTAPRYQNLVAGIVPVRREPGAEIRVFSGVSGHVISPTLNHVPVTMIDAVIEPGASFLQRLAPDHNCFVFVLEGIAAIGSLATQVEAGQLAWLTRGDGNQPTDIQLGAKSGLTRLLLFSGGPLREPVAFGGPFVMNTDAEIREAFADYRAGRF